MADKANTANYIVQHVKQELKDVRTYTFDFGLSRFHFDPGQFVIVALPTDETVQGALTLCSSPLNAKEFELTLKRSGDFGAQFFDQVRAGDIVRIGKPTGPFKIDPRDTRPICFIARDYCIPAARSIYRFLNETQSGRPFCLLHEISGFDQVLYNKELAVPSIKNYARWITLDQPNPPANWPGPKGRVTADLVRKALKNPLETLYYITGEGPDVKHFKQVLDELHIPSLNIRQERWS